MSNRVQQLWLIVSIVLICLLGGTGWAPTGTGWGPITIAHAKFDPVQFKIEEAVNQEDVLLEVQERFSVSTELKPEQCLAIDTIIDRYQFETRCDAALKLSLGLGDLLDQFEELKNPDNFPIEIRVALTEYASIDNARNAALEALDVYRDLQNQIKELQLAMDDAARAEAIGDLNPGDAQALQAHLNANGGVINPDTIDKGLQQRIDNRVNNIQGNVFVGQGKDNKLTNRATQEVANVNRVQLDKPSDLENFKDIDGARRVLPDSSIKVSDALKEDRAQLAAQVEQARVDTAKKLQQLSAKLENDLRVNESEAKFQIGNDGSGTEKQADFLKEEHRREVNIVNAQLKEEQKKLADLDKQIADAGDAIFVLVATPKIGAQFDKDILGTQQNIAKLKDQLAANDNGEQQAEIQNQIQQAEALLVQQQADKKRAGEAQLNAFDAIKALNEHADIVRQQMAEAIDNYEDLADQYNEQVERANDLLATVQDFQAELNKQRDALQGDIDKTLNFLKNVLANESLEFCGQVQNFNFDELPDAIKLPNIVVLPANIQNALNSLAQDPASGGGGGGTQICSAEELAQIETIDRIKQKNNAIDAELNRIGEPGFISSFFSFGFGQLSSAQKRVQLTAQKQEVPPRPDCQPVNQPLADDLPNNVKLNGNAELAKQKSILGSEIDRLDTLLNEVYSGGVGLAFQYTEFSSLFLATLGNNLDPRAIAEALANIDKVLPALANAPDAASNKLADALVAFDLAGGEAIDITGAALDGAADSPLSPALGALLAAIKEIASSDDEKIDINLKLSSQTLLAKACLADPNAGPECIELGLKAIATLKQATNQTDILRDGAAIGLAFAASTRIPFAGDVAGALASTNTGLRVTQQIATKVTQVTSQSSTAQKIGAVSAKLDDFVSTQLPTFKAIVKTDITDVDELKSLIGLNGSRIDPTTAANLARVADDFGTQQADLTNAINGLDEIQQNLDDLRVSLDSASDPSIRLTIQNQIDSVEVNLQQQRQLADAKADELKATGEQLEGFNEDIAKLADDNADVADANPNSRDADGADSDGSDSSRDDGASDLDDDDIGDILGDDTPNQSIDDIVDEVAAEQAAANNAVDFEFTDADIAEFKGRIDFEGTFASSDKPFVLDTARDQALFDQIQVLAKAQPKNDKFKLLIDPNNVRKADLSSNNTANPITDAEVAALKSKIELESPFLSSNEPFVVSSAREQAIFTKLKQLKGEAALKVDLNKIKEFEDPSLVDLFDKNKATEVFDELARNGFGNVAKLDPDLNNIPEAEVLSIDTIGKEIDKGVQGSIHVHSADNNLIIKRFFSDDQKTAKQRLDEAIAEQNTVAAAGGSLIPYEVVKFSDGSFGLTQPRYQGLEFGDFGPQGAVLDIQKAVGSVPLNAQAAYVENLLGNIDKGFIALDNHFGNSLIRTIELPDGTVKTISVNSEGAGILSLDELGLTVDEARQFVADKLIDISGVKQLQLSNRRLGENHTKINSQQGTGVGKDLDPRLIDAIAKGDLDAVVAIRQNADKLIQEGFIDLGPNGVIKNDAAFKQLIDDAELLGGKDKLSRTEPLPELSDEITAGKSPEEIARLESSRELLNTLIETNQISKKISEAKALRSLIDRAVDAEDLKAIENFSTLKTQADEAERLLPELEAQLLASQEKFKNLAGDKLDLLAKDQVAEVLENADAASAAKAAVIANAAAAQAQAPAGSAQSDPCKKVRDQRQIADQQLLLIQRQLGILTGQDSSSGVRGDIKRANATLAENPDDAQAKADLQQALEIQQSLEARAEAKSAELDGLKEQEANCQQAAPEQVPPAAQQTVAGASPTVGATSGAPEGDTNQGGADPCANANQFNAQIRQLNDFIEADQQKLKDLEVSIEQTQTIVDAGTQKPTAVDEFGNQVELADQKVELGNLQTQKRQLEERIASQQGQIENLNRLLIDCNKNKNDQQGEPEEDPLAIAPGGGGGAGGVETEDGAAGEQAEEKAPEEGDPEAAKAEAEEAVIASLRAIINKLQFLFFVKRLTYFEDVSRTEQRRIPDCNINVVTDNDQTPVTTVNVAGLNCAGLKAAKQSVQRRLAEAAGGFKIGVGGQLVVSKEEQRLQSELAQINRALVQRCDSTEAQVLVEISVDNADTLTTFSEVPEDEVTGIVSGGIPDTVNFSDPGIGTLGTAVQEAIEEEERQREEEEAAAAAAEEEEAAEEEDTGNDDADNDDAGDGDAGDDDEGDGDAGDGDAGDGDAGDGDTGDGDTGGGDTGDGDTGDGDTGDGDTGNDDTGNDDTGDDDTGNDDTGNDDTGNDDDNGNGTQSVTLDGDIPFPPGPRSVSSACADNFGDNAVERALEGLEGFASTFQVTQIVQESGSGDGTLIVNILNSSGGVVGSNTGVLPTNGDGTTGFDFDFSSSDSLVDFTQNGLIDDIISYFIRVDGFADNSVFEDISATGSGQITIVVFINIDVIGNIRIENSDGDVCLIEFRAPTQAPSDSVDIGP